MACLNVFSIGEVARSGTGPEAHLSRTTMFGYILWGLLEYHIFSPLFFYRLIRNWRRQSAAKPPPETGPDAN
ncbi:MAG: hypothetical protein U1E27_05165 [Kiritimatiellia bacterium]|nr:hypothetical protein [Kiritimatiellia bacterium]